MTYLQRFFISILLFGAASAAWGGPTGTIGGTVTDQTGAAVPGASVTLRDAAGAVAAHAFTGADGAYTAALAAGRYELLVEREGFETYRRSVDVPPGASLRAEVQLALRAQSETMVVSETVFSLDAADSQIGHTTGAKQMTGIPMNGRGYTDLLALQPGVVPANSQQPNAVVMSGCTSAPPSGDLNPGTVSISGQRETANGFRVNGSTVQEDFNMGAAVLPNLDSILDLRVLTSNFAAEYGNYGGGQVLVTTKSGSNDWHGSAFEFLRNTALDARNFFSSERARYDRNQFGGTLGGPIRRNRAFFFADFQGTQMAQGVETGLISVPSAANRAGDFSADPGVLSGTVNGQYWADLLTGKLGYGVRPGEPYYTPGCGNTEQCVLPGARIPQRAWSAPAQALLPYIPLPNAGASTFSTSAYDQKLRDDKAALRLDVNRRWGALAGYYFADDYRLNNPYPTGQGGANVPGFDATTLGRAQLASAGLTTVFGASAVNELRLSYLRNSNNVGQANGGVGPSLASQGFTGIVAQAPAIEGIENVSFNDFTMGVDITGARQTNNTYEWSDQFSKTAGRHTLKFGAGLHVDQVNINPDAIFNGSFLFQGTETGSDFADFLLGIASSYAQGDSRAFYLRNRYAGLYAQDSWQVRPGLTLNYGVRWDLLPPWREKFNQLQTLVPGQQSAVYPGAPAELVFPGDAGIPNTLAPTRYRNFAPRVGAAWSPASKTTMRAGYGLYYTAIEGLSAGIMSANPPYGYDYDSFAPPLFATPFVTAATGDNVGQRFPEPIPASGATAARPNSSVDWSQYLPVTGVPSFFPGNVTPYSESYTLSIEREVAPRTVLTASYVGTQAHHLLVLISANPGDPARCLALSQPDNVMPGTATCGPFGESGTYVTRSGQTVEGTRGPFSDRFAAVTYQKTIGNSNYNALEASLHRTMDSGQFDLSYTYGKSLDQSSSLSEAVNPLNANRSKALSAFDLRHNFVASYDWKLPRRRLTSGWRLTGVARIGSGLPVTLYNNNDTSLLGTIPNGINNNGVDTPDVRAGDLRLNSNPRNGEAFNTALFALPALGQVGSAARRFFSGPGMANLDAALHKTVALSESRTLELRVEAFNVLNHSQFFGAAAVNGNITSGNFGRIVTAADPRLIQLAAKFSF